jgi:hypothetical protein
MNHSSIAQEGEYIHIWGPAVLFPGVQSGLTEIGFLKLERIENR